MKSCKLPRHRLRIGGVEVIQKQGVRQIPAPGSIVSHGIDRARNIIRAQKVAVVSLMEAAQWEEIGWGSKGSGGPFSLPINGGSVVG